MIMILYEHFKFRASHGVLAHEVVRETARSIALGLALTARGSPGHGHVPAVAQRPRNHTGRGPGKVGMIYNEHSVNKKNVLSL